MADSTFPAANVDAELNPGTNKNFEEDSGSSLVTTSKEIKDKLEAEERKQQKEKEKEREKEKKDAAQTLKKSIIISAVVVAVVGAIFALTKKLREK
ncbi:hypothetical protein ACFX13_014163 [Malus domestica]|uniref:Uncharacterized protein n=1 Tax=Malus baccata TaxID=106549 RepID=A0A540MN16_MALBA|nr:A-kinase anchor protein 13-like [Malus domestica]XP_018507708.1 A-kinase anchor protein 13-like [Pyrus x bretschneideri]XP_050120855.1 uncharacterized protein LOC126598532 [Malus sylvestris]TQE00179.1 hypothetical protein C1H46_014191 [Malus baccata]